MRLEDFTFHRSLGGVSLEGGANTTAASIHRFILCMMRYPEVQRKGQAEMDSIVGSQRMPHINDIVHLPYVRAIIKEVHSITLGMFCMSSSC